MRLVTVQELLTMPIGTIFSSDVGVDLNVFFGPSGVPGVDFIEGSLTPSWERDEAGERPPTCDPYYTGRHGMYDEEEKFLVYEKDDLYTIMDAAIKAIGALEDGKTKLAQQSDQDTTRPLSE